MRNRCRAAAILTSIALMAMTSPAVAGTQIASPVNSTIPHVIRLVGTNPSGVPDPAGRFEVIYRDIANNPIPSGLIRVDLSNAPELHFCATQAPGLIVHAVPGAMYVEGRTDAAGRFAPSLTGGSNGAGGAVTLLGGARIYADGELLGAATVAAFDLDGAAGVAVNDLSVWLRDFGAGIAYGRSDYDGSDAVGVNDLSLWLLLYGAGQSSLGCAQ